MESFKPPSEASSEALINEHALLAAGVDASKDQQAQQEIIDRLKEIEQELKLSPHEIARRALSRYKAGT